GCAPSTTASAPAEAAARTRSQPRRNRPVRFAPFGAAETFGRICGRACWPGSYGLLQLSFMLGRDESAALAAGTRTVMVDAQRNAMLMRQARRMRMDDQRAALGKIDELRSGKRRQQSRIGANIRIGVEYSFDIRHDVTGARTQLRGDEHGAGVRPAAAEGDGLSIGARGLEARNNGHDAGLDEGEQPIALELLEHAGSEGAGRQQPGL